jgi:hypothetical protein
VNPRLGWVLFATGLMAGWQAYGWRGLVLVATFTVFWLLLQFNRTMRVMSQAAQAPVGQVDSAVMLQVKLRRGMPLLEVVTLAHSLGRRTRDDPETFEWRDASGVALEVVVQRGRCERWALRRERSSAPAPLRGRP